MGVGFAAKLVRGAYMNIERRLAAEGGYPDPVQPDFRSTTASYERAVELLMERAATAPNKVYFIVASHNAESIQHARNQWVWGEFL